MVFCETKFIVIQEAQSENQTEKGKTILNQWDPVQIECIYTKSNTDLDVRGETASFLIQSVTGR